MAKTKPARRRGSTAKPNAPKTSLDGATEQRILEAARAVFVRKGTAGARMQEIAAEAGVNQALLHYYFRSKERLSAAVFQQVATRLFPAIAETLGSDLPLDVKIDRFVALYLENLQRAPFLPAYLLSELHYHPERVEQVLASVTGGAPGAVMRPLFKKLGTQIDERVRAGTMRRIAPEQFAANLISLCIFPFAARPMFRIMFEMDDASFAAFIERRKTEIPEFVRNAIRP
jgi:TetR/AcrR family transcriptional regulator